LDIWRKLLNFQLAIVVGVVVVVAGAADAVVVFLFLYNKYIQQKRKIQ